MPKFLASVCLVVVLLGGCNGQPSIPQDVKSNIIVRVDKGITPSIVVGYIDGDSTYYYSYGVKSVETKEPVNEYSVYEIGSISKTFTAILLANMAVKGQAKLNDPVQNYLPPGVTAPTRNGTVIRLVNLSNHTSSLPRMPDNFPSANPANPFADYSEKMVYEFLNSYQLTRDVNTQYEYSNYAAGLLGLVLSTRNGKSYEDFMTDVIARPLGMENTAISLTPNMTKNLAIGHQDEKPVSNWDIISLAGAGGIRSTTVDMITYVRANMGITKSELYPAMELTHKNTRGNDANPLVGLGWHITKSDAGEIVWHNGGTGGYRTFAGFIKNGSKGAVVMTNSVVSIDDIGMHLLNPKAPLVDPDPPKIEEVEVSTKILETYVGKYELMKDFVLTVTLEGNQLNVQATAQPKFPVFAKSENVFFYKVVQAQLTFNKNSKGEIESVTLFQNGQQVNGKRMKE
ncbi:serine hydrolase [Chryseolinea sp. T2]|uniref:serine hydrolase n=1 Tax=Chryseolinea sp. T2 TaxID=3129255 RepID=UPI003076FC65